MDWTLSRRRAYSWSSFLVWCFVISLCIIPIDGRPIRDSNGLDASSDSNDQSSSSWSSSPMVIVLGVAATVCAITALAMCTCCYDALFSAKADTSDTLPRRHSMEPPSESSLNTPRAVTPDLSGGDGGVTIEPLPDLTSAGGGAKMGGGKTIVKPMGYNQVVNRGPDVSDWFQAGGNAPDFPRAQLQYVKQLGDGWFGSVVEGEASKMSPQRRKVKVIVQILREDLTSMERAYMMHTAKMFRDVAHENVLKIVGKCVDKEPYLLLYEHCPQADYLKSYLIARRGVSDDLVHSGAVLKMCCDVADGLTALHAKGFVHSDLATRNCLISNGTVKIGDYGTAISVFKNEYMTVGDIAVPVRWISPDCVEVAPSGQILTKEITLSDNVWTLGVVVWEILEFGKIPYMELSDDAVISSVLKNRSAALQPPLSPVPQRERIYEAMRFCWLPASTRPSSEEMAALLKHIHHYRPSIDSVGDFDAKWDALVAARRHPPPAVQMYNGGSQQQQQQYPSSSPVPTDPSAVLMVSGAGVQPMIQHQQHQQQQPKSTVAPALANPLADAVVIENVSSHVTSQSPNNQSIGHGVRISPTEIDRMDQQQLHIVDEFAQSAAESGGEGTMISPPTPKEQAAERIEKRNFILTLSTTDLSAMQRGDLIDFYEYLSTEEIADLERRHTSAVREAEEARQRAHDRTQFLRMPINRVEQLSSVDFDRYMTYLDEIERADVQSKLDAWKAKQQREGVRDRLLTMNDEDLLMVNDEEEAGDSNWVEKWREYLNDQEMERLKRNLAMAVGRKEARKWTMVDDGELARVDEEMLTKKAYPYLEHEEAEQLRMRHEKLVQMRRLILEASPDDLRNLPDGEFEHYTLVLTPEEAEHRRTIRHESLERERLAKEEAEEHRRQLFALTHAELVHAYGTSEKLDEAYARGQLSQEEQAVIGRRWMEAKEAREGILGLDGDGLRSLDEETVREYHRFLTAQEIERIETARRFKPPTESIAPPAAPIMAQDHRSPSAQGSILALEALELAKDHLIEDDYETDQQDRMETIEFNEYRPTEERSIDIGREDDQSIDYQATDQSMNQPDIDRSMEIGHFGTEEIDRRPHDFDVDQGDQIGSIDHHDHQSIDHDDHRTSPIDYAHRSIDQIGQPIGENYVQSIDQSHQSIDQQSIDHDDHHSSPIDYAQHPIGQVREEPITLIQDHQPSDQGHRSTAQDRQSSPIDYAHDQSIDQIGHHEQSIDQNQRSTDHDDHQSSPIDYAQSPIDQMHQPIVQSTDQSIDQSSEYRSINQEPPIIDHHSPRPITAQSPRSLSKSRQHPIEPLSMDSIDSFHQQQDSIDHPALATPELRLQHHSANRDRILRTGDSELSTMSQDEFEDYFQYLSPDEIFDLEARRRRSMRTEETSQEGADETGGSGMEEKESISGDGGSSMFGGSVWEARDYVLHLSDHQLATMSPSELDQYSSYFSSDELRQLHDRRKESSEKLEFVQQSTDEELAVLPTEKLEDYLGALPESERASVRERVNRVQTRWLPETLRDEYAFREILKTVPSISLTSESESIGPDRSAAIMDDRSMDDEVGRLTRHAMMEAAVARGRLGNDHGLASDHNLGGDHGMDSNHGLVSDHNLGGDHGMDSDHGLVSDHNISTNIDQPINDETRVITPDHDQHHRIQRPIDNLFTTTITPIGSSQGGSLSIPELRLQAATPTSEMAGEFKSEMAGDSNVRAHPPPILKLDEDGLRDNNEEQGDASTIKTSTPLFAQEFADAMMKQMGDMWTMGSTAASGDVATTGLAAESIKEPMVMGGENSHYVTASDRSWKEGEVQPTTTPTEFGDLLGDPNLVELNIPGPKDTAPDLFLVDDQLDDRSKNTSIDNAAAQSKDVSNVPFNLMD